MGNSRVDSSRDNRNITDVNCRIDVCKSSVANNSRKVNNPTCNSSDPSNSRDASDSWDASIRPQKGCQQEQCNSVGIQRKAAVSITAGTATAVDGRHSQ